MFRHSSVAKRAAISLIALYALLLQSFVAAAEARAMLVPFGEAGCFQSALQSDAPAGGARPHHGPCCILACASCGCAFVAAESDVVIFPVQRHSTVHWGLTQRTANFPPLGLNFFARGPPRL